jgi:hypothetical protein
VESGFERAQGTPRLYPVISDTREMRNSHIGRLQVCLNRFDDGRQDLRTTRIVHVHLILLQGGELCPDLLNGERHLPKLIAIPKL